MAEKTVISASTSVRGHVRGQGDIEVLGHVAGDVEVDGDVTLGEGSTVKGNVSGRRLVIRGAVLGDLAGAESIALEDGARVVGDLRATSIGIGEGALVRGRVETTDAVGHRPAQLKTAAKEAPRPAPAARPVAPAMSSSKPTQRQEPSPATTRAAPSKPTAPAPKAAPPPPPPPPVAKKGPPPPVVPSLKKGAKATLKKKSAG
jgi:cytoskeletal protein CcmA (bactofilin family)